jgi:ABC-2 type transport system permease protein
MNLFLSLLKVQLKTNFGTSVLKYQLTHERKKIWVGILILLSIIVGIGSLLSLYTLIMYGLFKAGQSIGRPEMMLTIAFLIGQIFVLFFGIFYVLSAFYFSKDLSFLVPLPLKPRQILGSKMIVLVINEYLTMIPFLLPALIIYGNGTGQNLFYWFKALLLLLASPAIPLILDALFVIILMRFVNVRKNKDLFTVIGGLFALLLAVGINFVAQRIPEGHEQQYLQNILTSQTGLIEEIGSKFPPSIWATLGLVQHGWQSSGYLALFLGTAILLFIALLGLGNQIFYKGLLSGVEVTRKRKSLTRSELDRHYSNTTGPIWAIYRREWRILLRTPMYALNGLAGAFIGPLLAIMTLVIPGQSPQTKMLFSLLHKPETAPFITLGGLGLMLFTAGMNVAASTSISREGSTFWISKLIPTPPRDQILAKFYQAMAISVIAVLSTSLVLGIFVHISWPRLALLFFMGILGSIPLSALNLMMDLLRPKLVWNSEQEAIKQNMNSILGMLIALVVLAGNGFLVYFMFRVHLAEWMIHLTLAVIFIILAIASVSGLLFLAKRCYHRTEV